MVLNRLNIGRPDVAIGRFDPTLIVAPRPAANDLLQPGHDGVFVEDTDGLSAMIGLGSEIDHPLTNAPQPFGLGIFRQGQQAAPRPHGQSAHTCGRQSEKITTREFNHNLFDP
jgi:hypothetical protein